MKKLIFGTLFSLIAGLILVIPAFAAGPLMFTGSVGQVTDTDASSGGYYLRQVGSPAPAGYAHYYQWANPVMDCDPNNTPTVFDGSIDLSSMNVGDVAMIGLLDHDWLEAGNTGWQNGAYLYVYKNNATTVKIGPSDGNQGGEIVQNFKYYTIPGDETLDIVVTFYDGEISVEVDGDSAITDDYGYVKAYAWDEFAGGAYPGWDAWPSGMNMPFDFEVTGCTAPVERNAEITSPTAGDTVSGSVNFSAYLVDDDADDIQWAVRKGTCAAGTNTIFGNVDGHHDVAVIDQSDLSNQTFSFVGDMSGMKTGMYCFIYNPREDSGESDIRLTREFNLADTLAPIVNISSPTDEDVVSGAIDIVGSVTDDGELSHYNLSLYPGTTDLSDGNTHSGDRLNDGNWCTTPTSGTVYLSSDFTGNLCTGWDTTQYADGEYQIRLAARDAAGNRDISDPYNGNTTSVHVIKIIINNTPDNMDQCKKGGWEMFYSPAFKNQGDCVSWLQSSPNAKGNKKDN